MRIVSLVLAAAFLLFAPPARAGVYEHASLPPGLEGWAGWASGGAAAVVDGEALRAEFWAPNGSPPGAGAGWSYAAPPGTEIVAWRAERELVSLGGWSWAAVVRSYGWWGSRLEAASIPAADQPWTPIVLGGLRASRVELELACNAYCWPGQRGPAAMGVRNAVAVLRDDDAPRVSALWGELAAAEPLKGTATLSALASDVGGGLWRTAVTVDGRETGARPVDGGPHCRDLSAGPVRRFAARVPCPSRATIGAALDTTALPDGLHTIEVAVEDVAGNRTTVLGPMLRRVENGPRPAPVPAPGGTPGDPPAAPPSAPVGARHVAAWLPVRGRRASSATVAYGRALSVRGMLSDASGRAVVGEEVTVLARVADGPWEPAGTARSGPGGRFAVALAAGPSRTLVVAAGPARSRPLTLRVPASVALAAVRDGDWVSVAGSLRGGHVPAAGVLVGVQARRTRRWITLTTLRTTPDGQFRGRVPGARAGSLRATVRAQPGYPFATGASPVRRAGRRSQLP